MPKKADLEDLEVNEISLVKRPANKKKFIVLKHEEESMLEELKLGPEIESQLKEIFKAAKLTDEQGAALKDAISSLKKVPGVPSDIMGQLMKIAGYGYGAPSDKKEDMKKSELPDEYKPQFEAIQKSLDIHKAEKEELQKSLENIKTEMKNKEYLAKAAKFAKVPMSTDDIATLLKSQNEEGEKKVIEMFDKVQGLIDKSDAMKELGSSVGGSNSDAYTKADAQAKELMQKSAGLTYESAIAKVFADSPRLYEEYNAGK